MITNSYYYKRYLKNELDNYNNVFKNIFDSSIDALSEGLLFELEKFIFFSAFIFRKLSENNKITDNLNNENISVVRYNLNNGYEVHQTNRWIDNEKYNFEKPKKMSIKAKTLSNYLIHSYVFELCFNIQDNKLKNIDGFFVASDYKKDSYIYYVDLKEYIKFITKIIENEVTSMTMKREKLNDGSFGSFKVEEIK